MSSEDQRSPQADKEVPGGNLLLLLAMQECVEQLKTLNARIARLLPDDIRHKPHNLYEPK